MKRLVDEVIVHNLEVANIIVRALEEKAHNGVNYEVEWKDFSVSPDPLRKPSNEIGLRIYEVTTIRPETPCGFGAPSDSVNTKVSQHA